jgi:hypothetical protein
VGKAMREASKFTRSSDMKERNIEEEFAKLKAERNDL